MCKWEKETPERKRFAPKEKKKCSDSIYCDRANQLTRRKIIIQHSTATTKKSHFSFQHQLIPITIFFKLYYNMHFVWSGSFFCRSQKKVISSTAEALPGNRYIHGLTFLRCKLMKLWINSKYEPIVHFEGKKTKRNETKPVTVSEWVQMLFNFLFE